VGEGGIILGKSCPYPLEKKFRLMRAKTKEKYLTDNACFIFKTVVWTTAFNISANTAAFILNVSIGLRIAKVDLPGKKNLSLQKKLVVKRYKKKLVTYENINTTYD
jgi:hypothetical protein